MDNENYDPYRWPLALFTSNDDDFRRWRVDVGQTGFWEGREFRINLDLTVTETPIWLKVSCPVGFILQSQNISCDQGGIRFRAYRLLQGTPSGTFSTPVRVWPVNGIPGTPGYANQLTVTTGGSFTPGGGEDPAETIRQVSNPGGAGRTAGSRNTVSGGAFGERGLPPGDYYLQFDRVPGTTVNGLGIFDLIWEERPITA